MFVLYLPCLIGNLNFSFIFLKKPFPLYSIDFFDKFILSVRIKVFIRLMNYFLKIILIEKVHLNKQ